MANSILGNTQPPNTGGSGVNLQQLMQFKNSFQGDPKQAVMQLVQSGQMSNPQLQQAMQMAQQIQGMVKKG